MNLCSEAAPDADIVLLLSHSDHEPVTFKVDGKDRQIAVVPCRLSPRSKPQDHLVWIVGMSLLYRLIPIAGVRGWIAESTPWIRAIRDCDVVGDVRGGDSFSDIYGMGRFILGFLMAWTVILVRGEMVQFPQTYGPFKSPIARWLARYLLVRSSAVIARDERSRHVAQDVVGDEVDVQLSPDVAFSLAATRPDHIALEPSSTTTPASGVVGLNVNGLMYHGGYTRANMFGLKLNYPTFLTELVIAILAEHEGEMWLVPHTFAAVGNVESDQDASRMLRDSLPAELQKRVRIVAAEYDHHEMKGVIGSCSFFIGSRMHACIAALSQGIPCVGVAYSMKFEGVFESVGMREWVVDGRDVENGEAIERILNLFRARAEVSGSLRQRADEARKNLRSVFARLVEPNPKLSARSVSENPHGVRLPQP